MPLFFIKRSEVGVALLFFDKERERSGTLKKRERLTHCFLYVQCWNKPGLILKKILVCKRLLPIYNGFEVS